MPKKQLYLGVGGLCPDLVIKIPATYLPLFSFQPTMWANIALPRRGVKISRQMHFHLLFIYESR